MSPALPIDEAYAEEDQPSPSGGEAGFVALYAVLAALGSLCVIIIIIVVVCRCKAKRTRQIPDNGVIAIPTQNPNENVPTATETDPPIETATLTMPPALMEDMDALPVAVQSPIDDFV